MTKKLEISRELAERLERALNQVGVQDHLCDYAMVANVKKELRALLANEPSCKYCGDQGEIPTGETVYQGEWQPPEPVMMECHHCEGGDDPLPPLIQTLHANGDRIAMEATIVQQAQEMARLKNMADNYSALLMDANARIADLERGRGEAPFYISAEDWNVLVRDDVATARIRICKGNRGPFTEPLYAEKPELEACTSCDGSGEYIDSIGDWRGYCSCPAGMALKNKPAPVAVMPSLWEICVRDEPDNPESPCEYVYVSSVAERDSILRRGGASVFAEYACIDKVKELNQ